MTSYGTFGQAVLDEALRDLDAGVKETSRNDGPAIRLYADRFGLRPPLNWCSVATSHWLLRASEVCGVKPPVAGSPAARGLMAQFIEAHRWVSWQNLSYDHLQPGNVIIWWRVDLNSWQGHVGIIERHLDVNRVSTIEGNSGPLGDRVARMTRHLGDQQLLGVGLVDVDMPAYQPSTFELETAARYMELSTETMLDGEPRDPLERFKDE